MFAQTTPKTPAADHTGRSSGVHGSPCLLPRPQEAFPRAAWMWSEADLTGPLKEQAFTDVLVGRTRKTPSSAARWLDSTGSNSQPLLNAAAATRADSVSNKETAATAQVAVAAEWATRHPQEAADHFTGAVSKPDGAALDTLPAAVAADGITGAFNSWAATDAQGLREWLDASPPAPEMDQARLSLADVLAASDIGSSLDLAFQLSSETTRDHAVARYFRHWRKTDHASAPDWLNQNWSGLEPSTRQRLTLEQNRTIIAR